MATWTLLCKEVPSETAALSWAKELGSLSGITIHFVDGLSVRR